MSTKYARDETPEEQLKRVNKQLNDELLKRRELYTRLTATKETLSIARKRQHTERILYCVVLTFNIIVVATALQSICS